MTGYRIQDDEGECILALRRKGYTMRQIADVSGRGINSVAAYIHRHQKKVWGMKEEDYWQMVLQNRERLDKIIDLAMQAADNSDGEEPAKISAVVNAIEAQNKLLALPDFVKEQRNKNSGEKLTIVLDEHGFHTFSNSELEEEEDDRTEPDPEELDGAAISASDST